MFDHAQIRDLSSLKTQRIKNMRVREKIQEHIH